MHIYKLSAHVCMNAQTPLPHIHINRPYFAVRARDDEVVYYEQQLQRDDAVVQTVYRWWWR